MSNRSFYLLLGICVLVFSIWLGVSLENLENEEYKRCDPRKKECRKDGRRERCDGLNLIIKEGYGRESTAAVSDNSPKCVAVSDHTEENPSHD